MNEQGKKKLPAWLPLVVGAVLVVQFAGLGVWQVSRGLEKRAERELYRDETSFTAWEHGMDVRSYQRIRATGYYDAEHQVLLDNIIVNSRYGAYVITPLAGPDGQPVLLVNRGWLEKGLEPIDAARLELPDGQVTVRGRVGSLPRAGMKMGDAFEAGQDWPKSAVYHRQKKSRPSLAARCRTLSCLWITRKSMASCAIGSRPSSGRASTLATRCSGLRWAQYCWACSSGTTERSDFNND